MSDNDAKVIRTPQKAPDNAGRATRRTVNVIQALARLQEAGRGRPVQLAAIAADVGVQRGVACRYLQALTETGVVRQPIPGKGVYELTWQAPTDPAPAYPSAWMRARLARLQGQSGQIAMLFTPYYLEQPAVRVRVETAWGTHEPVTDDQLDKAPLDADAAGLVMLAAMHYRPRRPQQATRLQQIRDSGYAIDPDPEDVEAPAAERTHVLVAAPVMRGTTVAGSVAVMPVRHLMQSARKRGELIQAVLEAAGAMSGHLTGHPCMRAAA